MVLLLHEGPKISIAALPGPAVLTGLPRLLGGGLTIVSAIPYVFLSAGPVPLLQRLPLRVTSTLNGQCWMVSRAVYERYRPHEAVKDAVVEDLAIGRDFAGHGVLVRMDDLQEDLAVWMYGSFREAWHGLRKNTYPAAGGTPLIAAPFLALWIVAYFVAPVLHPWFLASIYAAKALSDRAARMPLRVTLLAPVTAALLAAILVDSAVAHWAGTARWKGRVVAGRR